MYNGGYEAAQSCSHFFCHCSWLGYKNPQMILNIWEIICKTENNGVFKWQCFDFDTEIKLLDINKMNAKSQAWATAQIHRKSRVRNGQHVCWVGQALKAMGKVRIGTHRLHSAVLNFGGSMPKTWRPQVKWWKYKEFSGICVMGNQTTRGLLLLL